MTKKTRIITIATMSVFLLISIFLASLSYYFHKGVFAGRLDSYLFQVKNYERGEIQSIKINHSIFGFGFNGTVVFKDEKDWSYIYLYDKDDNKIHQTNGSGKSETNHDGHHLENKK